MKNLLNRTLSVLCAVMLLISAVSAWAAAEEEPATPTDLIPSEEEIIPEDSGKEPEPEGETGEEGITSMEVVITKTLTVGQSWEGKMKKTKPAVLKLDVTRPGLVYMLVEGKDVWATVQKSDRLTENPSRTKTDPETDRMVISWEAEEGSYLITLGPVEPNLLAMATVSFMNQSAYDAWEEEQTEEEPEPEEEPEEVLATEPENEEKTGTETNTNPENAILEPTNTSSEADTVDNSDSKKAVNDVEEEQQDDTTQIEAVKRSIDAEVKWDVPDPVIGDTAHLKVVLTGYEELQYTVQWQYSLDKENWHDILNENDLEMDVVVDEENNEYYWRLVIYIEDDQES